MKLIIKLHWGLLLALLISLSVALACTATTSPVEDISDEATPVTNVKEIDSDAPFVVYNEEGFVPARIDVRAGQQVRFVNQSDQSMWPASNIHPTHRIFSEFDAKAPVQSGESWAFRFDKPGFWRYHNHISPQNGGIVVVEGEDALPTPAPLEINISGLNFEEPGSVALSDYTSLFKNDELLASYIEKYGPANTVRILSEASASINTLCHERAHDTGRIAYDLYGAAAFGLASHECESGSYHGATEALFRDRGTVNLKGDVSQICGTAPSFFFRLQCIHGVGHGLMAWTSYELFDALDLCDNLETDRDQRACYSGVFMENVVGGLSGSMGHHTNYLSEDDPHYPCNALEDRYIGPCYLYHSTRMLILFDYDYDKVGEACANAPEIALYDCFESFGRDTAAVTLGEPAQAIDMCHSTIADAQHQIYCLQGSVQARFWETEKAGEALSMCHMLDTQGEKSGCYWMIITRAKELYADDAGFNAFCSHVEPYYRAWCVR